MAKVNVLINGAGIAGPVLAYWLAKAQQEISVTIVERSPALRPSGQAIDIRDSAVTVMQKMGIEQAVRDKNTTEAGVKFVDGAGIAKAQFGASGSVEEQSFTSEFEILRSDLAEIMYEATRDCANFIYGEYATKIEQSNDGAGKVRVEFANGLPSATYDLVVGADGQTSKTRRLVFGRGDDGKDFLKSLGQFTCYFNIPGLDLGDKWARWYNATGGRLIFLRPTYRNATGAYVAVTRPDLSEFEKAIDLGPDAMKAALRETFTGAGWLSETMLDGMDESSDFYGHILAQVRMKEFVKGNVALIGDAGYCPTPITGMGTSIAIIGAYVLAGELSESPLDIPGALSRYQAVMKVLVDKVQGLPPGVPQLANPRSKLGISVLHTVLAIISSPLVLKISSWVKTLFSKLNLVSNKQPWKPPVYQKLD